MGKHRKHTKLTRRNSGYFAPNEIAILGTKCSTISDLVQNIAKNLQKEAKTAYLDASHDKEITPPTIDNFTFHSSGNLVKTSATKMDRYNDKILFTEYDMLFINGNHYSGEQQILILDNEKEASVLKRIDQLDNIQFLIKLNDESNLFDFLIEKHPNIQNPKLTKFQDILKI